MIQHIRRTLWIAWCDACQKKINIYASARHLVIEELVDVDWRRLIRFSGPYAMYTTLCPVCADLVFKKKMKCPLPRGVDDVQNLQKRYPSGYEMKLLMHEAREPWKHHEPRTENAGDKLSDGR